MPDALGGPNGFALKADAQKNSDYGSSVDSRLINSHLVRVLATHLGLETRSGPSVFSARGTLVADGSPVDVQLGQDSAEFRSRIPVVKNPDTGEITGVRGFGAAADAEVSRVTAGFAKKGLTVLPGERVALNSTVHVPVSFSQLDFVQGLGKIAYLTTVWTLGDAFITTAGAAIYRNWINAENTEVALAATGLLLIPTDGVATEFAGVSEDTHVLTCSQIDGQIVTCVRLFNNDLLSFGAVVDIPELSPVGTRMRVIQINSRNKTFKEFDY